MSVGLKSSELQLTLQNTSQSERAMSIHLPVSTGLALSESSPSFHQINLCISRLQAGSLDAHCAARLMSEAKRAPIRMSCQSLDENREPMEGDGTAATAAWQATLSRLHPTKYLRWVNTQSIMQSPMRCAADMQECLHSLGHSQKLVIPSC